MPRIATVFGATGTQGSAVVDALLKDGAFVPRAVTRDVNSEASRALAARGAQVVAADLGDKASVKNALSGAEVAFGVTIPFTPLSEVVQGENMVDAAKEEGVKFFVFSSQQSLAELSKGRMTSLTQAEEKAAVAKHLGASGVSNARIIPGFFLDNFINKTPLIKAENGYVVKVPFHPKSALGYTWVAHDLGRTVAALFKFYPEKISEINNVTYDVVHGTSTLGEVVDEVAKGLGKPIAIERIPPTGIEAFDSMYDFAVHFDLFSGRTIPDPRLEALGIKQDGTIPDFVREVLKPALDKQEAK